MSNDLRETRPGDDDELPVVEVPVPSADLLADSVSIINDLRFVIACCARLRDELGDGDADSLVIQALWSSSVTTYARCFKDGKRLGLKRSDVEGFDGTGALALHQWIMDMRNKHVAHSVNPFESARVGVILASSNAAAREVVGVAEMSMSWISATREGVESVGRLSQMLLERVEARHTEQHEAVLAEARQLDIDELYRQQVVEMIAPGPDQAGMPRP